MQNVKNSEHLYRTLYQLPSCSEIYQSFGAVLTRRDQIMKYEDSAGCTAEWMGLAWCL